MMPANTLGVVIVYATLTVPAVILQESFLAFIGLNVEWQGRTLDSWGALVDQGRQSLNEVQWLACQSRFPVFGCRKTARFSNRRVAAHLV